MRIRISDPDQRSELVDFLSTTDAIIEEIGDDEVEVSIIGSYNSEAMRIELYLRLRAWEASRRARGVEVEILG